MLLCRRVGRPSRKAAGRRQVKLERQVLQQRLRQIRRHAWQADSMLQKQAAQIEQLEATVLLQQKQLQAMTTR